MGLLTSSLDQVPLGDLDLQSSVWTPERIHAPMDAVNERLAYRAVEDLLELQRRLD